MQRDTACLFYLGRRGFAFFPAFGFSVPMYKAEVGAGDAVYDTEDGMQGNVIEMLKARSRAAEDPHAFEKSPLPENTPVGDALRRTAADALGRKPPIPPDEVEDVVRFYGLKDAQEVTVLNTALYKLAQAAVSDGDIKSFEMLCNAVGMRLKR